jgi:HEAT repeat protein
VGLNYNTGAKVTVKRMVAYHINRLQDKNPAVRLKAINELALLGDTDALEALQAVFQNDVDGEVRKAAQDAGRAIFLKNKQQQQ